MKKLFLFLVITITVFTACEEENPAPEILSNFTNGVFIVNEGTQNNGSLSFYSKDSMVMTNNIFSSLTEKNLGSFFQSMTIIGSKAYLVVNGSQKIEVLDLKNKTLSNTIIGLSYPRYLIAVDENRAYISNGNGFSQDYIYILNTTTDEIIDSIAISTGPETFLKNGDDIYVACKGGYLNDNRVFIIDTKTNAITDTIVVGDVPADFAVDAHGDIWVLANGRTLYDENWAPVGSVAGKLVKIDPVTKTITKTIDFPAPIAGFGSNNLAISADGLTLYINNASVEAYNIETDTKLTLIENTNWYGIDVDPESGKIWGTSFSGKVYIYNTSGDREEEFTAGSGANACIFIN
jgi:YVTN family beta-propeller protein